MNQRLIANKPLSALYTHGLLGQTWVKRTNGSEIADIEGVVDDYSVLDGLFGTDFMFNEFKQ